MTRSAVSQIIGNAFARLGDALAGRRAGGWLCAAALATLAWIVYAAHWPLSGAVIPWDAKDYYYPVLRALAAARADGDSGFWNPYLYSGVAAVADPQSWLFTPVFRLLAELDAAPSMTAVDMTQLLHLLAGGLGLIVLARRFGWAPVAGLLGALVFMFGGVAASRLQHSLMTVSYAYLPWALWLLARALHGATFRTRLTASAAFGLVAGAMAVDRDQAAFLNCWLLIGATLWWLEALARAQGVGEAARRVAGLLPAVVLGLALLALPMLLTLRALAESTRPDIGYAIAGYASQPPASLLTLLAPDLFGNLRVGAYWGPGLLPWMALAPLGNDWTDETTNYLYIGAVPLALLLVAWLPAGRWPKGSALCAAGLGFALLYALGANTPAFRLFYEWLPGVSLYRRPNDAAFAINAMLALLTGAAAQRWLTAERNWRWPRIALVGAPILAALAYALWLASYFGHVAEALGPLFWGLAALAVAVALLRWPGAKSAVGLLLLCGLAAGDLIARNAATVFNARPAREYAAYAPAGAALAYEIKSRMASADGPWRAEIFGLGGDWQNAPMVYGIEQTLGYDPLRRADYVAATGAYQNNHEAARRLTDLFAGYDSPLARLLGIRVVAVGKPIEEILPTAARRSLRPLGHVSGAYLYENEAALPRVLAVGRAVPDGGGALPQDPTREVAIAGLPAPIGEAGSPGTARIVARSRDRIRIAVDFARPGYLVVNDLYDAGWRVTDSARRDLPLLRANRLFRAVALPAGRNEIAMRFMPLSCDRLISDGRDILTK